MIVTSHLFPGGRFDLARLIALSAEVGRERLVVDIRSVELACLWLRLYSLSLGVSQLSEEGWRMGDSDERMEDADRYYCHKRFYSSP